MIIMISAANADVCLSMARIIKGHSCYKQCRLVGLTPDVPWPALQYFDEVLTVPMASDSGYGVALSAAVDHIKLDVFIPFSEAELSWFVKNPEFIKQLDTRIVINPLPALEIFLDKKKTADFLKSLGLPVPGTYLLQDITAAHMPLIIKPRSSAGSKNMAIIRNAEQLSGFLSGHRAEQDKFIAQELIDVPDAEFTCGVWQAGAALRYCTFRRRLQGGMTGFAKVEQHSAIDKTLETIAAALAGDFFINVQLRLREGIPYVFEVNPRFSSTVMMRHKIGFEDFIWTLDALNGDDAPPAWQPPVGTMIFRTSDECVVNQKGEII